jgi:hypothetical protein
MTALRHFFAALVLALTLVASISAGEISTGIVQPQTAPTSPSLQGDIHTTVDGDITTMNADAGAAGSSVTDAALALVQSVLSLF